MWRFLAYLSKSFIMTWLMVVFGILVLICLLASLANGSDILADGGNFVDTFRYMALLAPVIFDRLFIFTIHVAVLLTFVKLIRNHELVALLGFGVSTLKQVLLLTPAVVGVAIVSIFIINTAMPPSVRALQAWGIGEYRVKNVTEKNPLWMEGGNQIVRATQRFNMNTIGNIELFNRSPETGAVESVTWAERAEYLPDGNWKLTGVQSLPIEGADGEPRIANKAIGPQMWNTAQTPQSIARLAADPRDIALSDMRGFMQKGNSGSKPSFAYEFWHWHRLTRPLAALILLLCAAPIMQRTGRQDTGDKALITGIALGFVFLIMDGAMATFAASGGVGTPYAICFPLILFALGGLFMLLRTESLT